MRLTPIQYSMSGITVALASYYFCVSFFRFLFIHFPDIIIVIGSWDQTACVCARAVRKL